MCGWNLMKLSQMLEHFAPRAALREIVGEFEGMFEKEYNAIMARKLGLGVYKREGAFGGEAAATAASSSASSGEESKMPDVETLAESFFEVLAKTGGDFTNSFRVLGKLVPGDAASYDRTLQYLVSQCCSISTRLATLTLRIPEVQLRRIQQLMVEKPEMFNQPGMEEQNTLIEAEIDRLRQRDALRQQTPEAKAEADTATWRKWLDSYVQALSVELAEAQRRWPSKSVSDLVSERTLWQNGANPRYILRNWIAQSIIEEAEKGNYAETQKCLERLRDPYDLHDQGEAPDGQHTSTAAALEDAATKEAPHASTAVRDDSSAANQPAPASGGTCIWAKNRPAWAAGLKVTCSS